MNIFSSLFSSPVQTPRSKKQSIGIEIKSEQEIEIMRQSAKIVATVLKEISQLVKPGMTTLDLDVHAEKRIREMGATPSFKGYHGFPSSICASINNEVVHGIPNPKKVIRSIPFGRAIPTRSREVWFIVGDQRRIANQGQQDVLDLDGNEHPHGHQL